jgi:hypothetical protein
MLLFSTTFVLMILATLYIIIENLKFFIDYNPIIDIKNFFYNIYFQHVSFRNEGNL